MSWSLFVDGSAIWSVVKNRPRPNEREKNSSSISYSALAAILNINMTPEGQQPKNPSPAFFFTGADHPNKLHSFLATLGWTVRTTLFDEANVINPVWFRGNAPLWVRFDSPIAYCIGRLVEKWSVSGAASATVGHSPDGEEKTICVVTDSFGLVGPIMDAVGKQVRVVLSFFGTKLDSRWHKTRDDATAAGLPLTFLNLDNYLVDLFGAETRMTQLPFDLG